MTIALTIDRFCVSYDIFFIAEQLHFAHRVKVVIKEFAIYQRVIKIV